MNEIKTDLFPDNLRSTKNDTGRQEMGARQENGTESMKAESECTETMTPEEPLPETERPRKDGPGGA